MTIEYVAGYSVLEPVGQGRFGVVYRAQQEHLARTVALKVLLVDHMDDRGWERFRQECPPAGHPNILPVLETGTTGSGRPYIAMEYCERGSLGDRLAREGPLSVGDVLRVGVKIAGALAAAHETGVLHRDVKPRNILVLRSGEPALADFGLGALADVLDLPTGPDAFTSDHTAPEVLAGEPPTAASDVYALGSTLYHLLAAQPAFRYEAAGGARAHLLRILGKEPPDIPRFDVERPVIEVIRTAMARRPEERPDGALALADRLRAVQRQQGFRMTDAVLEPRDPPALEAPAPATAFAPRPTDDTRRGRGSPPAAWRPPELAPARAQPPPQPTEERQPRRRWPVIAGGLAATALVAALGVGAYALVGRAPSRPPATVPAAPPASPAGVPPAVVAAARPQQLMAVDGGTSVVLHWQPGAGQYAQVVQQVAAGQAPAPLTVLGAGTRTTTLTGLDPSSGYCFSVGTLVATGRPATIAWSLPACIRGAAPSPSPTSG